MELHTGHRIPLKTAPKTVSVDYLAFYQTAKFGNNKWAINYAAPLRGQEFTASAQQKVRKSGKREQLLDKGTNVSLYCKHVGRLTAYRARVPRPSPSPPRACKVDGHLTNCIVAHTSARPNVADTGWRIWRIPKITSPIRHPLPSVKMPCKRRRFSSLPRPAGGSGRSGGKIKVTCVPSPPAAKKIDSQKWLHLLLRLFDIMCPPPTVSPGRANASCRIIRHAIQSLANRSAGHRRSRVRDVPGLDRGLCGQPAHPAAPPVAFWNHDERLRCLPALAPTSIWRDVEFALP
jgi:hypothetical protein